MRSKAWSRRRYLLLAGENAILLACFLIAESLRFGAELRRILLYDHFGLKAVVAAVVFQIALYYGGLYEGYARRAPRVEVTLRFAEALFFGMIALQAVYYMVPSLAVGRGILAIYYLVSLFALILWRTLYWIAAGASAFAEPVLIMGTARSARHVAEELLVRDSLGFELAGFLTPHEAEVGRKIADHTVLGVIDDLPRVLTETGATRVVVALDNRRGTMPLRLLVRCRLDGTKIDEAPDFYERLTGKILLANLRPSWLVFSQGFEKPQALRSQKMVFEVACAALLMVLLSPILLLIAIAIKLDSSGPVLYRQERVGERSRPFWLLKFRTMRTDAEVGSGPVWASAEQDPRVTRVGRWLRMSRLDELPQLLNVLRGEMSFVGPRPERPHFVERLRKVIPYYDERHAVKPGITGWAQIKYRYSATIEEMEEKLEYDLFYIKHMSWIFDLGIAIRTVKVALLGKGAR